jgi:hypothetical protein
MYGSLDGYMSSLVHLIEAYEPFGYRPAKSPAVDLHPEIVVMSSHGQLWSRIVVYVLLKYHALTGRR